MQVQAACFLKFLFRKCLAINGKLFNNKFHMPAAILHQIGGSNLQLRLITHNFSEIYYKTS
ncbi:hypothetical protein T07_11107 [Trichinella nelsoni]|uniref:Uncharacterized protein n=1 Tax=Trichinella nelsoni TaxID=6336 RepID=A0A0V0S6B5_9BILA|nr:hypothetical protein T07_11107 [Trichinella nelsoni]